MTNKKEKNIKRELARAQNIANGKCYDHPNNNISKRSKRSCDICLEKTKWSQIKTLYGLTKEEYLLECEKRNYKCDLCEIQCERRSSNTAITVKKTSIIQVDHDHITGIIRGFLCFSCNNALGQYNEDIEKITNLANKIENYLTNAEIKIDKE